MSLVEGIEKLKRGAILAIIGDILAIGGIGLAVVSVGVGLNPADIQSMFLILGAVLIPFFIAMVLAIIAFIFWFQATGKLREVQHDLGVGRTGMILQILGTVLMILSMTIAIPLFAVNNPAYYYHEPELFMSAFAGMLIGIMTFMALGGILIIIGAILFGIMLLRLSKIENVDQGFNTAGILYLISIGASVLFAAVGSILMFVALILVYSSANKSLKNLRAQQSLS